MRIVVLFFENVGKAFNLAGMLRVLVLGLVRSIKAKQAQI